MKIVFSLVFCWLGLSASAQNREHAFEINSQLGRGINFGNMFEAPSETEWGNPWQVDYPRIIAELGFNHVRIPIRWEPAARSSAVAPYTLNDIFLQRIKQVVDSCVNNGLLAIINMHHHEALYADPDGQKARFLAQWKQISEFFKGYPDQLLFEILNEPHGELDAAKWNTFLQEALDTIREDNPERIVLIGTAEYGGLGGLSKLQIPDDPNIILTVHYYNPFTFTHQGAEWSSGSEAWLGTKWTDTETERQVMQNDFAPLIALSQEKNMPVHVGEFGAYSKADSTSRKKWTTYLARYFESLNWSWAYWEFSAGFGIYNPSANSWNQFLVNALLHNPMPEPAYYMATLVYNSDFSSSAAEWNLYTNGGASAQKQSTDKQLQVKISIKGTEGWHIQLVKNGIVLEAGKKYRLTFKARATAQRTITAYTGQSISPWGAYSGYNNISLTTDFAEYSYVFDMTSNDNSARIVFDLGTSPDDVHFESIVLESVELQEPSSAAMPAKIESELYPNPVKNELVVFNTDGFDRIHVCNSIGQMLLDLPLTEAENRIGVSDLKSGNYFVSLIKDRQRFTVQIIKL